MRKLTRISEFNNKQRLHLMKERPMRGKGLVEVLTRLHKLYKIAAPIVKATNSIYRAPIVQKHIIPKSVKKHLNHASNQLANITDTVDTLSSAHKFLTGGSAETDDMVSKKVKEVNPATDLLKTVSKKVKTMKLEEKGSGLYPVGISKSRQSKVLVGGGLTDDILKEIISVIAMEMIAVIVKQVNKKLKLTDEKSKMLENFLTGKMTELLKSDITLPNFSSALGSLGKIITSPLKHMFGGGNKTKYKQEKNKIMKRITTRANKLIKYHEIK